MMKSLMLISAILVGLLTASPRQEDVLDNMAAYLKSGNAKAIANSFAASVELNLIDVEDAYAKAQAEQIIRDFFSKHPPLKATLIHRLDTNPNFRYGAFLLTTKSGEFRTSITMKRASNGFIITEFRVENDK